MKRENIKIVEEEGNKNEKGEASKYNVLRSVKKKKRWFPFFDYFNRIFNLIFLQLF